MNMINDNVDDTARELERAEQIYLPTFKVHNHATANWVVRKIIECRNYIQTTKDYAAKEIARAERVEKTFGWLYGKQLEAWLKQELEQNKRPGKPDKSLNLPAGRLGMRTIKSKLEVRDSDAVMAWARQHCPDAVVVEEKLSKSALNEHLASTGELPDGAVITEATEAFYIK